MESDSIGIVNDGFIEIEKFDPDYSVIKSEDLEVIELADSDCEIPDTVPVITEVSSKAISNKEKVKKKRQNRFFNPRWHTDYGYIEYSGKALCLFCGTIQVYNIRNLKGHFSKRHSSLFKNDVEKELAIKDRLEEYNRCNEVNDIPSWFQAVKASGSRKKRMNKTRAQKNINVTNETESACNDNLKCDKDDSQQPADNFPTSDGKRMVVECSYMLSQALAKNGRPFSDGEFMMESFIACADVLFNDFPNKSAIIRRLKNVPTSSKTLELRYLEIASTFKNLRAASLANSPAFSIALELMREGSSGEGGARVILVIRFCGEDSIFEELCNYKSFEYEPTGQEIMDFVKSSFEQLDIDSKRLFACITDNSPLFVEAIDGFFPLLEGELGRDLLKYHCLINQERLISYVSDENLIVVMDSVKRILRFVLCNSPKLEALFKQSLCEIGVKSYSNLGWLGRGKVLELFIIHLQDIKEFIKEKKQNFPELSDMIWLNLLMYLTDITLHLNELESSLTVPGLTIYDLFQHWKAFISKLKLFIHDVSTNTLQFFPFLQKFYKKYTIATGESVKYTEALMHEFSERLDNMYAYEQILPFLVEPHVFELSQIDFTQFPMLDLCLLKLQFAEFKNSQEIFNRFQQLRKALSLNGVNSGECILKCWSLVPKRFNCLKWIAFTLLSAFGSIGLNDQIHALVATPVNQNVLTSMSVTPLPRDVTNYEPAIKRLCLISQMDG